MRSVTSNAFFAGSDLLWVPFRFRVDGSGDVDEIISSFGSQTVTSVAHAAGVYTVTLDTTSGSPYQLLSGFAQVEATATTNFAWVDIDSWTQSAGTVEVKTSAVAAPQTPAAAGNNSIVSVLLCFIRSRDLADS